MWNWSAALAPFALWFLYRRLYSAFFLYFTVHLCLALVGLSPFGFSIIPAIVQGARADRLLFRKAREAVRLAGESCGTVRLTQKGKPLAFAVWVPLALIFVAPRAASWVAGSSREVSSERALVRDNTVAEKPIVPSPWVVVSRSGQTQITVPGAWEADEDFSGSAEIQVFSTHPDLALVVFTESRGDFPSHVDLPAYAGLATEFVWKGLADVTVSPAKLMNVQGSPAVQYQVTGMEGHLNLVYWVTTIQTARYFHRVIAWTPLSAYAESEPLIQGALQSFRETAQPAPTGASGSNTLSWLPPGSGTPADADQSPRADG